MDVDVYGHAKAVTYLMCCCRVLPAVCMSIERFEAGPESALRSTSALQMVQDVFQQMCVLCPAHLGTSLFYCSP